MSLLQRWLFVVAGALPVLHSVGVPSSELAPIAWIGGGVASVALVATLAEGEER